MAIEIQLRENWRKRVRLTVLLYCTKGVFKYKLRQSTGSHNSVYDSSGRLSAKAEPFTGGEMRVWCSVASDATLLSCGRDGRLGDTIRTLACLELPTCELLSS
jgi:hypothetical protein